MDIKILQESFTEIESNSKEFARLFYQNLFLDYPQIKNLFANVEIEQQEKKLMTVFIVTIGNLHNRTYLNKLLKSLGKRHLKYGVSVEEYQLLGNTLIKTLRSFLGSKWSQKLENTWRQAYQLIVQIMLEGSGEEQKPTNDRSFQLPSLVEKLRLEAIAKRCLRNGHSLTEVKYKLLEDYYFKNLTLKIGEKKTLEKIAELLQRIIQTEFNSEQIQLIVMGNDK